MSQPDTAAATIIHKIEEKPSWFVDIINKFTILCSLICYGIIAYLLIYHFDLLILLFTDYDKLNDFIAFEYKGPIFWIAMFFNVVLSVNPFAQLVPIPQLISFFYGFERGMLFCILGAMISYILTLYLARSLGSPIVKKIIGEKNWEKVQILADEEGVFPFFIGHLFPIFPDAIVAWVAGTTRLSIVKLTIVSTIARLPGMALTVLIGSGQIVKNPYLTSTVFITLVTISLLLARYRKQIMGIMNRKK